MTSEELIRTACSEVVDDGAEQLAMLLTSLIEEEAQSLHQTRPIGILNRLTAILSKHVEG